MKPSNIDALFLLQNNTPLEDFCGLTPNEVHQLLYYPFADKSPLRFRNDIADDVLENIPFFRIAEEFLKLIQRDKQIKLTPLGALPKKVMVEIYDHKFLLDEMIESGIVKLWKEQDCISIMVARLVVDLAGLIKKSTGKLFLTKEGTRLLKPENRLQLFKEIFKAHSTDFNWGYCDGYPQRPIGQLGFGFSLYLLDQFGEQLQSASFYVEKYMKAFPQLLEFFPDQQFSSGKRLFERCYRLRTIDRFLEWYGFVTVERIRKISDDDNYNVKRNNLFRQVFLFE